MNFDFDMKIFLYLISFSLRQSVVVSALPFSPYINWFLISLTARSFFPSFLMLAYPVDRFRSLHGLATKEEVFNSPCFISSQVSVDKFVCLYSNSHNFSHSIIRSLTFLVTTFDSGITTSSKESMRLQQIFM